MGGRCLHFQVGPQKRVFVVVWEISSLKWKEASQEPWFGARLRLSLSQSEPSGGSVRAAGRPADILQDVVGHGFQLTQCTEGPIPFAKIFQCSDNSGCDVCGTLKPDSRQRCPPPAGGGYGGHDLFLFTVSNGEERSQDQYAPIGRINPENVFDSFNQNM